MKYRVCYSAAVLALLYVVLTSFSSGNSGNAEGTGDRMNDAGYGAAGEDRGNIVSGEWRHTPCCGISDTNEVMFLIGAALSPADEWNVSRCAYNGIRLYGKVKVVTSFPDIRVKVVDSFPDINVKVVSSFPDSCGKWQFVESFPDFTIQFVDSFPDIKIRYVDSFPGMQ